MDTHSCNARAPNHSHRQCPDRCSSPSYPQNNCFWHFKALWLCRPRHLLRNKQAFICCQVSSLQRLCMPELVIPALKATGSKNPMVKLQGIVPKLILTGMFQTKALDPSQWEITQIRAIRPHKIWGNQFASFCIYTFIFSPVFADIKLATIQKKALQLHGEMCGIYITSNVRKLQYLTSVCK